MKRPASIFAALAAVALGACADNAPPTPVAPNAASPVRSPVGQVSPSLGLSQDIAAACKIEFGSVDHAPKFDFDDDELLPADRDVLQQVAVCVTTGPLKGRALRLVGHADPRGEPEYNMALGARRAGSARSFLTHLGVDPAKLATTSRGELDATGKDEEGWRRDRRVDILLQR
jgi:peptidoglycan-associated lipoprotein